MQSENFAFCNSFSLLVIELLYSPLKRKFKAIILNCTKVERFMEWFSIT